jgi:hypothetical protein
MRRLPVRLLLLGCAGLLLGVYGGSPPRAIGEDEEAGAGKAPGKRKGVSRAAAQAEKGPPFRLPADAAGALLGEELAPKLSSRPLRNPSPPSPPAMPFPRFAAPRLLLPAVTPDLPRLPAVVEKTTPRPEFVQEEALEDSFLEVNTPEQPSFAAGRRTRISSEDATLPPPLPVTAQPSPDRASLEDATMEVSTELILAGTLMPVRKATPYQRMSAPEPFEHHIPLTLDVPGESAQPQAGAPRPPKP